MNEETNDKLRLLIVWLEMHTHTYTHKNKNKRIHYERSTSTEITNHQTIFSINLSAKKYPWVLFKIEEENLEYKPFCIKGEPNKKI